MSSTIQVPRLFSAQTHQLLIQLKQLTVPILITQLAQIGMATIDTLMSGHVGTADLAAIAIGSSLWTPAFLFVAGVLVAFTPIVARLAGAQQKDQIPELLGSAVWCGIIIGAGCGILLYMAGPWVSFLLPDENSARLMTEYLQAVCFGLPAAGGFLALRFHAEALNQPGSVTRLMLIGLVLNIPANAIFVYGWFGIEAMGGAGCGWGTSIIFNLLFIAILFDCYRHRLPVQFKSLRIFFHARPKVMKDLFKTGLPIGSAIFFEVSFFSVIALFLSPLGTVVVAGHQVAINVSSLTFMVPLSVAMAITVMVGQQLGKGQPELALQASWLAVKVNLVLALLNASLIYIFADAIADLYSKDPQVVAIGASLLALAAIYQFSDAIQIAAAGALRGYEDTLVVMLITFLAYWVCGIGLGYYLTYIYQPALGAKGFWLGIIFGLTLAAIMLGLRLRRVGNKHLISASG